MSKNKPSVFMGAATALITPFLSGKIDFDSFGALIDHQIESSIDALVVAGTTGEASTLDDREYEELISFARERIAGRVPLIVGTGSNDIFYACELTKKADALGADACLVVTPYYNKATKRGLFESYKSIAESTRKPIILYNVPTRTCVNIPLEIYKELSKIENIVAVKEAAPDISATAELIFECGDDLDIYTGSDDQILPVLALGGAGAISVASNVIPGETHSICHKYFAGNWEESRDMFKKYYSLMRSMFCEVNPIPVKTALSLMGKCQEEFRLPLCRIGDENRRKIQEIMRECSLI